MNSESFVELRKKSGMTQSAVASALGVTTRTIYGWENSSPPKVLSHIEAQAARALFAPKLIEAQLAEMAEQAFDRIPSELAAIWIVQQQECVLFPAGIRYHDVKQNVKSQVISPQCVSPLVVESLTTYPLRTGNMVNLAGDAILRHPAKKYKHTRAAAHFQGGMCESLLHVPAFSPSARGPRPVLLLSMENKLDEHGRVIIPRDNQATLYTPEDEEAAKQLAAEFQERLEPDMVLLEMVEHDDA